LTDQHDFAQNSAAGNRWTTHARTKLALPKLLDVQPEKPGGLTLCAHDDDEPRRRCLILKAEANARFRSVGAAKIDFYLVRSVAKDNFFVSLNVGPEICT